MTESEVEISTEPPPGLVRGLVEVINETSHWGHTGLQMECPMCIAHVASARLLAHLRGNEMPEAVQNWDRRVAFIASGKAA